MKFAFKVDVYTVVIVLAVLGSLAAAIVVLGGCYRDNDPNLLPDYVVFGGDASACEKGCANLKTLGCPEGSGSPGGQPCADVCARAVAAHVSNTNPSCWISATTREAAAACGVRCVR